MQLEYDSLEASIVALALALAADDFDFSLP